MPSLVLKSEVPVWALLECRLEGDHSDSKQQEEKEDPIVIRSVTCDLVEYDSSTSESDLLNILIHILEMIMELCVGVEYMNFHATCKRYPFLGDKYFKQTPHELIGFQIYCSRYGWLLMYKIDGPLVFYNPFTNDIRELPAVGYLQNFCFSAPPTSSDCMVVGLTSKGESHLRIHFVAGEPSWLRLGGDDDPSFFRFPTFCGQDLYVLCNDTGFDVYRKVGHKDYSWDWESVIAGAPRSCTSPAKRFLAKCDRHLFLVVVGEFGESVEVFKVNESKKEWEKIDCPGKHMIYICDTTCLCIEAKLPQEKISV
nr:hypothetical protein [Tanacetum cinerariifolium]